MKRPSVFFWLLLPPAFLLFCFSLLVLVLVVQFIPAPVVWASLAICTVVVLWFFLVRRRGNVLTGSESSLAGRQSSREGLL